TEGEKGTARQGEGEAAKRRPAPLQPPILHDILSPTRWDQRLKSQSLSWRPLPCLHRLDRRRKFQNCRRNLYVLVLNTTCKQSRRGQGRPAPCNQANALACELGSTGK